MILVMSPYAQYQGRARSSKLIQVTFVEVFRWSYLHISSHETHNPNPKPKPNPNPNAYMKVEPFRYIKDTTFTFYVGKAHT